MVVIIGLFCLTIIITVHELGHYIFARLFSVTVHEFAIGIGPVLYKKQGKNTTFTIRAFPLGGFCNIESANVQALSAITPENKKKPIPFLSNSLYAQTYPKKLLILLGGIIANIVFFFFLYFLLFIFQFQQDAFSTQIDPLANSPAMDAKLQTGDTITHVNNKAVSTFEALRKILFANRGKEIEITFIRNTQPYTTSTILNRESPVLGIRPFIEPIVNTVYPSSKAHIAGIEEQDIITSIHTQSINNALDYYSLLYSLIPGKIEIGYTKPDGKHYTVTIEVEDTNSIKDIGISFPQYKTSMTFPNYISTTTQYLSDTFIGTFNILFQLLLFNTNKITDSATGPIRLVSIIGNSTINNFTMDGFLYAILGFIRIVALVSLGIGIFNLLPIPVLDGGHILFHSIFQLLHKIPSYRAITIFNMTGLVVLLGLFMLVIINDISFLIK